MSTATAIVNGTIDTAHPAVVTVVSDGADNTINICTGTIVRTDPGAGIGWVATAAHCLSDGAPRVVIEGPDYRNGDRVRHAILGYASDDRFDIDNPANGYDFAVVRISGVTAATPVIPLATAPDRIAVGTPLSNVGFGRTTRPPADADTNSERHLVSTSVGRVSPLLLAYDSSESGACQGDSGGPWLVGEGDAMRVAGIDSYGNKTCDGFAFAGRVQAGLDFFHAQLGLEAPDPCELCKAVAQSSGGKCATAVAAGLSACLCGDACVDACRASAECGGAPACAPGESCASDAGAAAGAAPAPTSDAGPDVVVVHKKGSGCNAAGPADETTLTLGGALAALLLLVRLRPSRWRRR